MDQYRAFISDLARRGDPRVFINSDEGHAGCVLVEMFNDATGTVRIFAGSLCEHVGNSQEYIEALSSFIDRGGKLRILLNRYDEGLVRQSALFRRLAYYVSEDKDVQVKWTNATPYLTDDPQKNPVHFTVADEKAYRLETDIEKRTARCCFNDLRSSKNIADLFDRIFDNRESSAVDLKTMFNYGAE